MNREATDDDVAFLVRRIKRITAAVIQAHADGYGPSAPSTDTTVADIVSSVLGSSVLEVSTELANEISEYYLGVYRYMVARGSPIGTEVEWLATTDLFRMVGDGYKKVAGQSGESSGAYDRRDLLQTVQHRPEQFRLIASFVDAETARMAYAAVDAIAKTLDSGSGANPLTANERELMHLLVAGNTIEAIGTELNVSGRTVHRRLQSVWDQVGASSRTEGIAIVSARGWLD